MGDWNNADGLNIKFGVTKPDNLAQGGEVRSNGSRHTLTYRFDYTAVPSFTADLNNDGTKNGFSLQDVGVPAGASVESAKLRVGTAWAGGTSLAVGSYQDAGGVIDADGYIDATAGATANLTAGSIITGAGADVGELVHASAKAYTVVAVVGTFTAGDAEIIIDYIV